MEHWERGMRQDDQEGDPRVRRAVRIERTMIRLRWAVVAYAAVQIVTYYRPHPDGKMAQAFAVVAVLAAGNLALHAAARRLTGVAGARRLFLAALALDWTVAVGLVFVYTFDPDTAMWAVVYVLPLEGAIRFQLRGALWTMSAATLAYTARELYGAAVYGNVFYATSISFRMGIGFIIAAVAGVMARNLVREREELELAKAGIEHAARQLEVANTDLRAANAVKDDFLAMTNHEVRTPLTTILGYTGTLRMRWDNLSESQRREFVDRVEAQGERLLGLVETMLTLSTVQEGALRLQLEPVLACEVARLAIDESGVAPGEVELRCPDDLRVLADPVRLRQVLTNYLSNAAKYGRPPIVLEATTRRDGVQLCVSDAGPGVPEAFVDQLFERFTRAGDADARPEGVGLGLAIVRQLVEAQGGRVWYEPGDPGSRFYLRLPAATGTALPEAAGERAATGRH